MEKESLRISGAGVDPEILLRAHMQGARPWVPLGTHGRWLISL